MEVFVTSPWIPVEWIKAHGLAPRSIWATADFWPGVAPTSAGVCEFAEAVVRYAQRRSDAAFVFASSCDQLRRGFDCRPAGSPPRFLFNLPATWQTPAAKHLFRSEVERLGSFLGALGGRTPTPVALRAEMERCGDARVHLSDLAESTPAKPFAQALARFQWEQTCANEHPQTPRSGAPLALVGGPFCPAHWPLFKAFEDSDAFVALNATETGERALAPRFDFDTTPENPFEVLVEGYFNNIADVFQRPNSRLYDWMKTRLRSRHIRGIVLWHLTACDLWRAEAETMRETFGLPLLVLESDTATGVSARELNRLQAFTETLR